MISLSLYSSSNSVSVSVHCNKKKIKFLKKKVDNHDKSNTLILLLKEIFMEIKPSSINKIFFSRGPGSFTSLRSLIAIAQGIRIFSQAKIYTVTMFEIFLIQLIKHQTSFLFIYQDGRSDFYFQFFELLKNTTEKSSKIQSGSITDIKKKISFFQKSRDNNKLFIASEKKYEFFSEIDYSGFFCVSLNAKKVFEAASTSYGKKSLRPIYHHPHYGRKRNI